MNTPSPIQWERIDTAGWIALTEGGDQAVCAFQTNAWLELLESSGLSIARFRITVPSSNSDQPWQAGFCALEKGLGPLSRLTMPLLTPYLGWVLPQSVTLDNPVLPASTEPNLEDLLGYRTPRFPIIGVCSPPNFAGAPVEMEIPGKRLTCFLDLRPGPDSITEALNSQAGRHLRKIERNPNWTIRQAEGDQLLPSPEAYHLFQQVWMRRGQTCPVSQRLFTALWSGPVPAGFRRNWVAFDEGQPRALVTTIESGGVLNYAIAACHPDALSSGIATALVVQSARDGSFRGLHTYDLVGANTPSITQFKMGLGAKIMPYPCHNRTDGVSGQLFRGWNALKRWKR